MSTPTAPCDRFESEGLLRLEQGLPLGDHFETCPDCLAARAAYDRLCNEIAAAGEQHEPPAHWQSRVWATVEARRKKPFRSWRWLWVPAGAAAAAVLILLVTLCGPEEPALAALRVEIEAGPGAVRRGGETHPGDRLVLRATTGAARYSELRVYRHDTALVLRCSTAPPCLRKDNELRATLLLDAPGSYQSLLLLSAKPLPEPSSDLDRDSGAALAAGAEALLGREIRVQ
jgi:hypothetical protein